MNELETRLAETLRTRAERAPSADDVLRGLEATRRARSRRGWAVPALAVVTAAAVIVGGFAWLGDGRTATEEPVPATEPVVPDGMRLVGWGRVAIAVPEHWGRRSGWCGPGEDDVVHVDRPVPKRGVCPTNLPPPSNDSLQVLTRTSSEWPAAPRSWTVDEVAGVTIERGHRTILVPSEGVAFLVDAPDLKATAMLDTFQVLPDGWTSVPHYFFAAGGEPPTVDGLETVEREVWRPERDPGDLVRVRPAPGTVLPVGSTLTALIAVPMAPIGYTDAEHRLRLHHCGAAPTRFAGRRWEEVRETLTADLFDSVTGRMRLVGPDRAVWTSPARGARIAFRPADGKPEICY